MALNYTTLIAYIDGLYGDGSLSEADYQLIINYILANGSLEGSPRDLIQIRRGNIENLPTLAQGEFGLTLDTENLYIGGLSGNILINNLKNIYQVKNYSSSDDRLSIQNTINECSSNGGGFVLLEENKTYILNSHTRLFTYDITSVKMMLELKDNVTIIGGKNSIIKVDNNFTDGGDYVVFGSENVKNASLIGFTLDQNGENNTVIDSGPNIRRAYGVRIYKGENILLHNVNFENCPGRNVVNISDILSSFQVDNVLISNCVFKNVGGTITGNSNQSDHSTLYIQASNTKVYDNVFINEGFTDVSGLSPFGLTAIEIHEGGKVYNNKVDGYRLASYIVNVAFVGEKFEYHNNKFNVTRSGVQIWSTFEIEDCSIKGNTISLYGPAQIYGIYQYTDTPTQFQIKNLIISNNIIKFNSADATQVSGGITITGSDNSIIIGNIIEGCSGDCIRIVPSDADTNIFNTKIVDNIFKNYGFTTGGTAYWGVYVIGDSVAEIKYITIDNNLFLNENSLTNQRGIRLNGGLIDNLVVGGLNQFINLLIGFDQTTSTNHTNITPPPKKLYGELTFDPVSLADGVGQTSGSIVVTGASFGDYVQVSAPYDLQGCVATAYVVGASVIKIRVQNNTGGVIDLPSGTWKVKVTN